MDGSSSLYEGWPILCAYLKRHYALRAPLQNLKGIVHPKHKKSLIIH